MDKQIKVYNANTKQEEIYNVKGNNPPNVGSSVTNGTNITYEKIMIIPSAKETIENIEKQKIITSNVIKKQIIGQLKNIKYLTGVVDVKEKSFNEIVDKDDFIKQLNDAGYNVKYSYESWEYGDSTVVRISIKNEKEEQQLAETIKQNNKTLLITGIVFGIILLGMYFNVINFK